MPSKLALHVLTPSPAIDALIRSANWAAVKAVGNPAPLVVAAQAGIACRIFRQYGVEAMDPAGAVAAITAHDLNNASHIQIVCEDAKGYDPVWQLAVMDGLRARGYTGRYLICGAATGNPPKIVGDPPHFPELEPLYPLLRRPDTDLSLDAYSGLLVMDPRWAAWAPYTVFRPALIRADLARQGIAVNVVVTESGGDNIAPVTTGGGWQTRNWSSDEYLGTLLAVDADDRQHPWLLARCLFTSGPTPDWWAFDIAPIAGQLAAYVATQAGTAPQRAQDAPQGTGAAPTAPAPVVSPPPPVSTPASPAAHKEGHPMAAIPEYDQGDTKLCGIYGLKEVFAAYGYLIDVGTIYQAVHGHALPDSVGEAATFEQEKAGFVELCTRLGVKYQTLDVTDPQTLAQVVRDGWITLIGVNMADLQAGDNFGHFMLLPPYGFDGPNVHVIDSDRRYDGNTTDVYPWTQVVQACVDNWATPTVDGNRDAVAFKILG